MTVIVDGINDKVIVSSARDAGFMINKAKKYIIGMMTDGRRSSNRTTILRSRRHLNHIPGLFIWNAGVTIPITIRSLL